MNCGAEETRLHILRHMVDHLAHLIENQFVDPADARKRVYNLRFQVELLFPGRQDTFDMIYGSRFKRLIKHYLDRTP